MTSKKIILIIALLTIFADIFAQASGNSVTNFNNKKLKSGLSDKSSTIYLSDSSFIIEANVLMNVIADSYIATFSVSQEANNVKDCNEKIDKRIKDFLSALNKFGISQNDVFVDFVTQTQIADYRVIGNYSEQYISGFELKKNVIIHFKNISDLDKIVVIAAEFEIYDLTNVEYNVLDVNKIYLQLFNSAVEIINQKKELYSKATNSKLLPNSEIFGENFYAVFPIQLYNAYAPNISSSYYDYNDRAKRKELRQNKTYYYQKVSYSGYDKIINPVVVEPAVEYGLTLQIKFNIEKIKK